ncbi:type II secretion system F family protein [Usitatibacter palustris]|uniref:Type II secretion system protein F n=1 Tax=Usitatibacter palustris TaxID=2732487 RepID=A0A6M4HA45_9PROT|nr:type II secretion system F family protein [Usitatibacter palustris]QJR16480.1 Type II secretion system protein F [Usitatibacter palustris]
MPFYQYKAVSPTGEVQEGVLEAATSQAAIARLQDLGLIPIRAEEAAVARAGPASESRPLFERRSISQDDIGIVTREMATLLKAGLPLDRSMEILINLAATPRVAELLAKIRNEVRGGASLSKALDAQQGMFSRFYVNMIRAGEAGGSLPGVLVRLAEFMERAKALKSTVTSALVYPAILFAVSIFSVVILLVAVVPRFKPIFEQSGKALPFVTQAVLVAGDLLRNYWYVLPIGLAGFLWFVSRKLKDPEARFAFDRSILRWPLVGDLVAKVEMARFARTLGTLLSNGVPLVGALGIVRETMGNGWLAEAVGNVGRELKEGRGLGRPMMETGRFPLLAVHMIQVGEETGRLDEMLLQVATTYDVEVEQAIRKLLAFLEPAMILLMAVIVAAIILSMLTAMLTIYDLPI